VATVNTVKQMCLGVAVAGVVAGAGSIAGAGVALAEPSDSGGSDSSSSSATDSSADANTPRPGAQIADSVGAVTRQVTTVIGSVTGALTDAATDAATNVSRIPAALVGRGSDSSASTPRSSARSSAANRAADSDAGGPLTVDQVLSQTGLPTASSVIVSVPRTAKSVIDSSADVAADAGVPAELRGPVLAVADSVFDVAAPVVDFALTLVTSTPVLPAPTSPLPLPLPFLPAAPASAPSTLSPSSNNTRSRNTASGDAVAQLVAADTDTHVLVIGVDGTNLSKILAYEENVNFRALMEEGTTSAATIRGHSTISQPSWSTVLTGSWGEQTGVVNNIFFKEVYDDFPTIFNRLEQKNPDIRTAAVSDWSVITDIASAGSVPADRIYYVARQPDDTTWAQADSAVGAQTVALLTEDEAPNFTFVHFVGVDENGHEYGGDSQEYRAALANVDRNLGTIMAAVEERESCADGAPCEDWTVIVLTDHGHQPQKTIGGYGHGFNTPNETSTFVIARGDDFADNAMNLQYSIDDVTPTVLQYFGIAKPDTAAGDAIQDLGSGTVQAATYDDLKTALQGAIALNGYPDIITNLSLSLRTAIGLPPYLVYTTKLDTLQSLQETVDGGQFPLSQLAAVAIYPVQIGADVAFVATNVPAQAVSYLTGVYGARFVPLVPSNPPYGWPNLPPQIFQQAAATNTPIILLCEVPGSEAACAV